MKLKSLGVITALMVFSCLNYADGAVIKDEAMFFGFTSGLMTYVDYCVTDEGAMVNPGGSYNFNFVYGDANAYTNESVWYYYYQIENPFDPAIVDFTLSLAGSDTIISAGWIDNANLDDAPFNHTTMFESEFATVGPVNPSSATYNAGEVEYEFDSMSGNAIDLNEYSTVLFVSSKYDATFTFSSMQGSDTFMGSLPVPSEAPVPEPMSMILLGGSIVGLVIKKRK